jgi:hypothetical protein
LPGCPLGRIDRLPINLHVEEDGRQVSSYLVFRQYNFDTCGGESFYRKSALTELLFTPLDIGFQLSGLVRITRQAQKIAKSREQGRSRGFALVAGLRESGGYGA